MHIALSHNVRDGSDADDEPPEPSAVDPYAEWDDIDTIRAVESALAFCHRVTLVNADLDAFTAFRRLQPDLVFNIAEGLNGASREAQIPAMLDMLAIPYTGSDPVTLGNCLDKRRTKEILGFHRISTPRFAVVDSPDRLPAFPGYPLIVKPAFEGSSKGVTDRALVRDRAALIRQVRWVQETCGQSVLVEEFLPGREFTVALLGNGANVQVLPIVEINFGSLPAGVSPIYSWEAKWLWDREEAPLSIFTCPARIEPLLRRRIEKICRQAFLLMGCRDWCRIDVRLDRRGLPAIIELNPLPGILPRPEQNSCFPKAARAAGFSYEEMILAVVDHACRRLDLDPEGQGERVRVL